MSNASLAAHNAGLTDAGARFGLQAPVEVRPPQLSTRDGKASRPRLRDRAHSVSAAWSIKCSFANRPGFDEGHFVSLIHYFRRIVVLSTRCDENTTPGPKVS